MNPEFMNEWWIEAKKQCANEIIQIIMDRTDPSDSKLIDNIVKWRDGTVEGRPLGRLE